MSDLKTEFRLSVAGSSTGGQKQQRKALRAIVTAPGNKSAFHVSYSTPDCQEFGPKEEDLTEQLAAQKLIVKEFPRLKSWWDAVKIWMDSK